MRSRRNHPLSMGVVLLLMSASACMNHGAAVKLHRALGIAPPHGSTATDSTLAAAKSDLNSLPTGANSNPTNPLDKGWFPFKSVVDGDTIWVTPLPESLRLLCVDAEETIKVDADREASGANLIDWDATDKAAEASGFRTTKLILKDPGDMAKAKQLFEAYSVAQRHGGSRPVKYGTPFGELAKDYARWFYDQADEWDGSRDGHVLVRLELDDPKRQVDTYGRYLCYPFVKGPGGEELNFDVEEVRLGLAPYFPKYGHSVKYKADFEAAMKEAQDNHRGIWSDSWGHYTDYPERLAWWTERGDTINYFASTHGADSSYFQLGSASEYDRLRGQVGREAIVYGLINDIRGRSDPATIVLAHTDAVQFPIDTTNAIAIGVQDRKWAEHYVYARGTVEEIGGTLHLRVAKPEDIWVEPSQVAPAPEQAPGSQSTSIPEQYKDSVTGLMVIPWQRAAEWENRGEVIVEGIVLSSSVVGKNGFLNFDPDFTRTFGVYIPPAAVEKFRKQIDGFPDVLDGRKVRVRGTVVHFARNDQDKPEIVADDPAQLTIVQ